MQICTLKLYGEQRLLKGSKRLFTRRFCVNFLGILGVKCLNKSTKCTQSKAHKMTSPFVRMALANAILIPPKIAKIYGEIALFKRFLSSKSTPKVIIQTKAKSKNGMSLIISLPAKFVKCGLKAKRKLAQRA